MKTGTNTAFFTGFFARTFKYLYETGLPLPEVLLLEETAGRLSPESFAMAMAHAYERALAIQKGMMILDEGLDKGAFHIHGYGTCAWFIPQPPKGGLGVLCMDATYGVTSWDAKMNYVLAYMELPIPMGDWLENYC